MPRKFILYYVFDHAAFRLQSSRTSRLEKNGSKLNTAPQVRFGRISMTLTWKRTLGAAILTWALACNAIFAQSDRATITGTVKDTASAVVPEVQVRVIDTGTNDTQTVTTDSGGL